MKQQKKAKAGAKKTDGEEGARGGMDDALDDEVLGLIMAALPAPDRLRCEGVCRRWRDVLTTRREFTSALVLPEDPLDDAPGRVESAHGGWGGMREDARDDSLSAAANKAGGELRRLDVSGCAEISHGGGCTS
jgi:hypothetical protein